MSSANKAYSCAAVGLMLSLVSLRGDERNDNRLLDFTVVAMGLRDPIDTATARFGESLRTGSYCRLSNRIHAVLLTDITDAADRVLIAQGSAVEGRIIQMLRVYGKRSSSYSLRVTLRWDTITYKGVSQPFTAKLPGGTLDPRVVQRANGRAVPLDGLFQLPELNPGDVIRPHTPINDGTSQSG